MAIRADQRSVQLAAAPGSARAPQQPPPPLSPPPRPRAARRAPTPPPRCGSRRPVHRVRLCRASDCHCAVVRFRSRGCAVVERRLVTRRRPPLGECGHECRPTGYSLSATLSARSPPPKSAGRGSGDVPSRRRGIAHPARERSARSRPWCHRAPRRRRAAAGSCRSCA